MDAKEESERARLKAEKEAKIAYVREHGHRMLDEPGDWEVKKATKREDLMIDGDDMKYGYYSMVCTLCVHQGGEGRSRYQCAAFPDGIPMEIWDGQHNHQTPYVGDSGIIFKCKDVIYPGKIPKD